MASSHTTITPRRASRSCRPKAQASVAMRQHMRPVGRIDRKMPRTRCRRHRRVAFQIAHARREGIASAILDREIVSPSAGRAGTAHRSRSPNRSPESDERGECASREMAQPRRGTRALTIATAQAVQTTTADSPIAIASRPSKVAATVVTGTGQAHRDIATVERQTSSAAAPALIPVPIEQQNSASVGSRVGLAAGPLQWKGDVLIPMRRVCALVDILERQKASRTSHHTLGAITIANANPSRKVRWCATRDARPDQRAGTGQASPRAQRLHTLTRMRRPETHPPAPSR